jgi:uncharacterized protein YdaU (DUF1376 family)
MKKSRYRFDFYCRDWLGGTIHLSLAARGLYIGLLALIQERHDKRILNDAMEIMPKLGIRDRRTWQKLMGELVTRGKIDVSDGWITNRRVMAELANADEEAPEHGEAAAIAPAEADDTNPQTVCEQFENSLKTPNELPANCSTIHEGDIEQNQLLAGKGGAATKNLEPRTKNNIPTKDSARARGGTDFDDLKIPKILDRSVLTALPKAWKPNAADLMAARMLGMDDDEIDFQADQFRNHYHATGAVLADWSAAWRGWIGRRDRFGRAGARKSGRERPERIGDGAIFARVGAAIAARDSAG